MALKEENDVIVSSGEYPLDDLIDKRAPDITDCVYDPELYFELKKSVPENIVNLIAASVLFGEVINGGYWQYFYNSYGVMVNEAIEGFRDLGLVELAKISSEARDFFGLPFPNARDDRQYMLGENPGGIPELEQCNDRFFEVYDEELDWAKMESKARELLTI